MKKFLEDLRLALENEISDYELENTLAHYKKYIESEKAKGKREEDILNELPDPLLLARSIIDANKISGNTSINNNQTDNYNYSNENDSYTNKNFYKKFQYRGCILPIILVIIFLTLLVVTIRTLVDFAFSLPGIIIVFAFFAYYLYKKR